MNSGLFSILTLLSLWVFWTYLWKEYAISLLREELFSLREQLFNLAHKERKIAFDSVVYRSLEITLNGTIRFGHSLSLIKLFIFNFLNAAAYPNRKVVSKFHVQFLRSFKKIEDKELKSRIANLSYQYEKIVVMYFVRTSLLFAAFVGGVILYRMCVAATKKMSSAGLFRRSAKETIDAIVNPFLPALKYQASQSLSLAA